MEDEKSKKFEEFDNLQELDAGEVGDTGDLEALCHAAWDCKPHNRRLVGIPAPRLMALIRALGEKKRAGLRFEGGVHSPVEFASEFLTPLFESGVITEYPGADYYAICYGELCAYKGASNLLATWSCGVPDCASDIVSGASYSGTWRPYPHRKKGG